MRRRTTSLRLRLTLSYGLLFFVVGFLLVGLSYVALQRALSDNRIEVMKRVPEHLGYSDAYLQQSIPSATGAPQTVGGLMRQVEDELIANVFHGLLPSTFLVLAVATAISIAFGWWMAGRMLRPVHEVSAAARRLSASTLHERIDLQGPEDELKELADAFDAMLVRLEGAFTAQRDFVANASHELRTPLAIMRTELDVTLADPETDVADLRRMAETIRNAIVRSEDVIDKLLVLAESDEVAEREPVALDEVVRGAVSGHERSATERGLTFAVSAAPVSVLGDRALLERLIDNLVDNAVRYASAGTAIEIKVRESAGCATLRVVNGGEVIDEREVPRLFERFYRRGSSRSRKTGGTGLGMAIVAAVAAAHGGEVSAEALPAGGLAVTVVLPLGDAASRADE